MRNLSISVPYYPEQVSGITSTKQRQDEGSLKRVRDVKHIEKRQRKYPRIFRVQRKTMTTQNQRHFAKLLNGYQLKALHDWRSFAEQLPDSEHLNDAQVFILQSVLHSQSLYPVSVKKTLTKYSKVIGKQSVDIEPSSKILQQLVAYEYYLEGLLSMLVLCRRYDQSNKTTPYRKDIHQEHANE